MLLFCQLNWPGWWNRYTRRTFLNPYYGCKIYGPYVRQDSRSIVVIIFKDGKRTTVSYPKYLMEMSIGRHLSSGEQIHHKDGNVSNNAINNLEIVKLGDHQRFHNPTQYVETIGVCIWCRHEFVLTKQHRKTLRTTRHKVGPFCSRKCSGKYGKSVQLGIIERMPSNSGKPLPMATPSQASKDEGVET